MAGYGLMLLGGQDDDFQWTDLIRHGGQLM